jgi:hypothetical protein
MDGRRELPWRRCSFRSRLKNTVTDYPDNLAPPGQTCKKITPSDAARWVLHALWLFGKFTSRTGRLPLHLLPSVGGGVIVFEGGGAATFEEHVCAGSYRWTSWTWPRAPCLLARRRWWVKAIARPGEG